MTKKIKGLGIISAFAISLCMLTACGGSVPDDVASKDIMTAVISSGVSFPEMQEVTADRLTYYYDVQEGWYSDFGATIAGSAGEADEVAVFHASSKDTVDDIETALNSRLEKRKKDFDGYVAEEYDKLCASEVKIKGNYVYLIVSKDNDTAESALEGCLK